DMTTQAATLDLLDQLRADKVTVMVSTHDLNLAASRFDAVLLINKRLIAYGTPRQVLVQENLSRAFGPQLMVLPDGTMLVDQCCPPDEEIESHREI
ncbi:MAG: manganese ABC transporter ATP-binding protein, partial [Anaerolineales bacterium]|nr:manganese ABC transporter ATP-binding protein [Anaerolineales bacterium]